MTCVALIPAAGSGSRVAGALPKQYAALAGKPMLWHAVAAVARPPVETVFVVLAPGDTAYKSCDWRAFAGRIEPLYCGGESRRESVYNGLVAAMAAVQQDDWVLVHDAARPCLRRAELDRLLAALGDDPVGGLLAVPVRDTLKRATDDGRVAETVPRAGLWHAQTPQMFRLGLLRAALAAHPDVTDEAMAMERAGHAPHLVEGRADNLKITRPEDLVLAAWHLDREGDARCA